MSKKKSGWKQASAVGRRIPQEDIDWLTMPAVGREFGSPDYERLMALDQAAFSAFKSWEHVRQWLATPNSQLGGARPEDAARSPEGHAKVMALLMLAGSRASDDFMQGAERLAVQERESLRDLTGMLGPQSTRGPLRNKDARTAKRREIASEALPLAAGICGQYYRRRQGAGGLHLQYILLAC